MSEYRQTCILYRHAFGLYRGLRTRARALQAGPDRARARVHIFFIFFLEADGGLKGSSTRRRPSFPSLVRACFRIQCARRWC